MATRVQIDNALNKDIILFDGVCNLCNGTVNFIIDRDKHNRFVFASLQSEIAHEYLGSIGEDTSLQSILLITREGKLLDKSNAVLRITRQLPAGWPLLGAFWIIPKFIRDFFYKLVANNRYKLFGRTDECRIPTPELKERFLDAF